ncbi:MAG: hypothetical protein U1F25_01785 [Rubrivivax sp.]
MQVLGAFGYILKEQPREQHRTVARISQGEPPLSPSIARRVMAYFTEKAKPQAANLMPHVSPTDRESEVLLRAWPATRCPRSACS